MVFESIEIVQGSLPRQNALLFLGLALAIVATWLLVVGLHVGLDTASRLARGLYYRRRLVGWQMAWSAALPVLGPLAVATVAWLRAEGWARRQLPVVARWAAERRRALRPVAVRGA